MSEGKGRGWNPKPVPAAVIAPVPFFDPADERIRQAWLNRERLPGDEEDALEPEGPVAKGGEPTEGADVARLFMAEEAKKNAGKEQGPAAGSLRGGEAR